MYHSKDRQIGTPRSQIDGRRGGTENALTTIAMKPTHMIGGYAQLSWAPNYYGPTGLQPRLGHDRAQAQPGGRVLMRVKAQVAMVMNLDKCIGCHTCSVTCKQVWTNRPGTEYVWFNNVETAPGQGYPRQWADQARWNGGWELDRKGRLRLKAGGPGQEAADDLLQPRPARDRRLLRAVHLRLRDARRRAARRPRPGRAPALAAHRQADGRQVGAQLGRGPRRRPGVRAARTRTCRASRSRCA